MSSPVLEPSFSHSTIQSERTDGYWVETFLFEKGDRAPGIIASGLVSGLVEYLENPIADPVNGAKKLTDAPGDWNRYLIATFDSPVAVCIADVTQNGLNDVIVCHDYGPFMLESFPDGGFITWLENPGRDKLGDGPWKEHYIGRWPAMHRVKAGHFTQTSVLEIVAASVVRGPHDKRSPIPIIRFQSPDTRIVRDAIEWQRDIIDDENFSVIHEITPRKFNGADGLDSLLVASREGTTHLWFDQPSRTWKRELITIGEPRRPGQSEDSESPGSGDHWGSGCVDAGRIGDDPFAYIATLDPFHGTTCCVLTKQNRGIRGTVGQWKRQVLDTFGTVNQLNHTGDGPGHFIICADFDGDGDDEFLLGLFGSLDRDESGEAIPADGGPNENKGILYYKCLDLENGVWAKWKVSDYSSARIALGDFDAAGRIDLVSVSYNVARYYEEPDPKIRVLLNTFADIDPTPPPAQITATLWDNEGLLYLSNPATDNIDPNVHATTPLLQIANYAISVEILPKKYELVLPAGTGIKVLYGAIKDDSGWRAPLSVPEFTGSSTIVSGNIVAHDKLGAVILRIAPLTKKHTWKTTKNVPVTTKLQLSHGLTLPPLHFIKVEDLPWGGPFKGLEFYNLSGFTFRFARTQTFIAHMQFWTAGTNVNCGVHNHSDAIFQEVHFSLSPGTGNGGMSRLKDSEKIPSPPDPKKLNKLGKASFDHLPLAELEEHGGMWERDAHGLPVRDEETRIVKYPFHKWQAGSGTGIDIWAAIEFGVDLDYRVEGIGEVEGSKKRVVGHHGVTRGGRTTCNKVHKNTHRGCC